MERLGSCCLHACNTYDSSIASGHVLVISKAASQHCIDSGYSPTNYPNSLYIPEGWILNMYTENDKRSISNRPQRETSWVCSPFDTTSKSCSPDSPEWLVNELPVDHCLSRVMPPLCELNMSIEVMLMVLTCNFLQLLIMFVAAYFFTDQSMLTLGDGVASFLEQSVEATKKRCLFDSKAILCWDSPGHAHQPNHPEPC